MAASLTYVCISLKEDLLLFFEHKHALRIFFADFEKELSTRSVHLGIVSTVLS